VTLNLVGNHDVASKAWHPLIRNDGTQGSIPVRIPVNPGGVS
jgi:hypothetical protein